MEQSGQSPDNGGRPEESPEAALMASFRVAAESVTQLYKTSLNQKTKYHDAGYGQCLQDLMGFISSHPSVQRQTTGDGRDAFISVQDLCIFINSKTEQLKSVSRRCRDEGMNARLQTQQSQHHHHQQFLPEQTSTFQTSNVQICPTSNIPSAVAVFENTYEAFNFSLPEHVMYNPVQREIDCIDTGQEGGIGIFAGNDSLKRRYNGSSELNFQGRSTFYDCSFYEPPTKKGRLRKEE
ncbi:11592_t:CDS:1 [Funneliformis mosseae]|uniref:11592_t:CDS:1 n=1 Tax=Funneliformis mosseae TaxID=27381 RepID=A0A9N9H1C9_FUNMO|nr:11592_t:CDS:1 [Funneliformis mosseae]